MKNCPNKCQVCGNDFTSRRKSDKYCSTKCRRVANNEISKKNQKEKIARRRLEREKKEAEKAAKAAAVPPHDCRVSWRRGWNELMGEVVIETRY